MITKTQLYLFSKLPMRLTNRIAVDKITGCWVWHGRHSSSGHGRTYWKKKERMLHRVVWEMLRGDLPGNIILDHVCRVRKCCNPTHVSQVTHKQNVHRGKAVLFKRK